MLELFLTDLLFFICPFIAGRSFARKLGDKSQESKSGGGGTASFAHRERKWQQQRGKVKKLGSRLPGSSPSSVYCEE